MITSEWAQQLLYNYCLLVDVNIDWRGMRIDRVRDNTRSVMYPVSNRILPNEESALELMRQPNYETYCVELFQVYDPINHEQTWIGYDPLFNILVIGSTVEVIL